MVNDINTKTKLEEYLDNKKIGAAAAHIMQRMSDDELADFISHNPEIANNMVKRLKVKAENLQYAYSNEKHDNVYEPSNAATRTYIRALEKVERAVIASLKDYPELKNLSEVLHQKPPSQGVSSSHSHKTHAVDNSWAEKIHRAYDNKEISNLREILINMPSDDVRNFFDNPGNTNLANLIKGELEKARDGSVAANSAIRYKTAIDIISGAQEEIAANRRGK